MPAATITAVAVPHTQAGYNLTDSAAFTVLVAGSGNGVKFLFAEDLVVVLKNTTGGVATFTLKVATPTGLSAYGASVTHPTVAVAAGKTYVHRLDVSPFRDATGYVTIECDVAGSALVLDP